MLKPVARIAGQEGRPVLGLAIAGTIAHQLRTDTGAPAMTIARFTAQHRGVLNGSASAEKLAAMREALAGALLLVDEASQISTVQMGDKHQLSAVEAGKAFAQTQAQAHSAGIAMAELPENLRARSPEMKAAAAALNAGNIGQAFEVLCPMTFEIPRRLIPAMAAAEWAALPQRDATLLLASGRAMRSQANAAAQAELRQLGELADRSVTLPVLDRVTTTREGARQELAYRPRTCRRVPHQPAKPAHING